MKRALLLAALVFVASVPAAFAYFSPGAPSRYVNDFAGVLSPSTLQSLEAELALFDKSTSNEVAVVIVPDMGGDYVEYYAAKLFEEWKIGKKERDSGVLLLLSIQERKMRIEVGYGLEGALPDSLAQSILDNDMTPRLKQGDYDGAVTAGVQSIERATKGEYFVTVSDGPSVSELLGTWLVFVVGGLIIVGQIIAAIFARSKSWWAGGVVGFLGALFITPFFAFSLITATVIAVVFTVIGLALDYAVSTGYANAKSRGVTPPWWTGGSGGSSSGGFGGFGGGGSGGGGASGGW